MGQRLGGGSHPAHKAFTKYLSQTRINTTPEQHLERARMAIVWGEAAVKYVLPIPFKTEGPLRCYSI